MNISKEPWGEYEGNEIYLLKLRSKDMEITLSNFGAAITSIMMPDSAGNRSNIVLDYDTLQEYIDDEFYVGCIVGRYAGRIAGAKFTINGAAYALAANDGDKNIHLHGGNKGFNKRAFTITGKTVTDTMASVELYYRSPHLEEGYPGNLDVWVTYQLSADNQLTINYRAVTDRDTHVNLTNHGYFNLGDKPTGALNNQLFINADSYLATDKDYIPTGVIEPVDDTAYNFKTPRKVADGIADLDGIGYNECYVLNKTSNQPCARLSDDITGRAVTVETDMPALLFYSGDYLNGRFLKNNGLCLETQFFPDAPNHSHFPDTLLKAGETWESYTRFGFSW